MPGPDKQRKRDLVPDISLHDKPVLLYCDNPASIRRPVSPAALKRARLRLIVLCRNVYLQSAFADQASGDPADYPPVLANKTNHKAEVT